MKKQICFSLFIILTSLIVSCSNLTNNSSSSEDTVKDDDYSLEGLAEALTKYDAVTTGFNEGLADVIKIYDGKALHGMIDKKGNEIVPCIFEGIGIFKEGLAIVVKNDKYGFINNKGQIIIPIEYDWAFDFQEGLARISKNGKWGFIDKEGKVIIPIEYEDSGDFYNGLAWVSNKNKEGFVNKTGKVQIPLIYDSVGNFIFAHTFANKDGKIGIIGKEGEIIVPFDKEDAFALSDDLVVTKGFDDSSYYMLNVNTGLQTSFEYDDSGVFKEKRAWVYKNGKAGYIDETGAVIIPFSYDTATDFNNGLARVSVNGKFGFIDNNGRIVIPLMYKSASEFNDGTAVVSEQDYNRNAIIDKRGELLFVFNNNVDLNSFSEGLALAHLYVNNPDGIDVHPVNGFVDTKGKSTFDYNPSYVTQKEVVINTTKEDPYKWIQGHWIHEGPYGIINVVIEGNDITQYRNSRTESVSHNFTIKKDTIFTYDELNVQTTYELDRWAERIGIGGSWFKKISSQKDNDPNNSEDSDTNNNANTDYSAFVGKWTYYLNSEGRNLRVFTAIINPDRSCSFVTYLPNGQVNATLKYNMCVISRNYMFFTNHGDIKAKGTPRFKIGPRGLLASENKHMQRS